MKLDKQTKVIASSWQSDLLLALVSWMPTKNTIAKAALISNYIINITHSVEKTNITQMHQQRSKMEYMKHIMIKVGKKNTTTVMFAADQFPFRQVKRSFALTLEY